MRKKYVFTALAIITFFAVLISLTPQPVYAKEVVCLFCEGSPTHKLDDFTLLERFLYTMYCTVYGGQFLGAGTKDVLKFDIDGTFADLWAKTESLYDTFSVVGITLTVVYVLYNLLTKSAEDELSPEIFFLYLMRLIISIIVARNIFTIVTALVRTSTSLADKLIPGTYGSMGECPLGIGDQFRVSLESSYVFIPYLASFIISLVFTVSCWSRILRVMVLIIFAPVGMADLLTDGVHSSGFGYLKRLLAGLFEGAVVLASISAYGIASSFSSNVSGGANLIPCILMIVMVISTFKATNIANDMLA